MGTVIWCSTICLATMRSPKLLNTKQGKSMDNVASYWHDPTDASNFPLPHAKGTLYHCGIDAVQIEEISSSAFRLISTIWDIWQIHLDYRMLLSKSKSTRKPFPSYEFCIRFTNDSWPVLERRLEKAFELVFSFSFSLFLSLSYLAITLNASSFDTSVLM